MGSGDKRQFVVQEQYREGRGVHTGSGRHQWPRLGGQGRLRAAGHWDMEGRQE